MEKHLLYITGYNIDARDGSGEHERYVLTLQKSDGKLHLSEEL